MRCLYSQTKFCSYKMENLTTLAGFFICVLLAPYARSHNCGLEEKLELLFERVEQLENKGMELEEKNSALQLRNSQLEMKVSQMEHLQHSSLKANESSQTSYNIFDCYLTENWSSEGIIKFNGCSGMIG